mmetsp:Transcript_16060/g.48247  ORF Transcript_16060/g.48247 Transcript_16060/m.48247 type:complete len:445 (-) Transcript_16060:101-1435(-)
MKASHLLVELLGQSVDTHLVAVTPQGDLSQGLVGEAVAHDKARVTGGAAEVDQATAGQQDDAVAVLEGELLHLGLDLVADNAVNGQETSNVDLVVEVTDVAHDGLVAHLLHVLGADDVTVAGGGDVDLGAREGIFDGAHLVAVHGGLQGTDRVDLGDEDASTLTTQALGTALSDVTEAAHHSDLAADHDVGGAEDTVDERVTAAVHVVELALGDRVVHVEGREEQLLLLHHLVEAQHTGGGLLAHALDGRDDLVPEARVLLEHALQEGVDAGQLGAALVVLEDRGIVLSLVAAMDQQSGVSTIVDDDARTLVVGGAQSLVGALPVLLGGLTLPGEHRHANGGDGSSGVVLGAVDVARAPSDLSAERHQGLDEHTGLNGHVQRAHDASTSQRLVSVLGTARHQTRHLVLGDLELLAAESSQADVSDLVVAVLGTGHSHSLSSRHG